VAVSLFFLELFILFALADFMKAIEGMTAHSEVSGTTLSGIIGALNRLGHSRIIIPNLETPYSRFNPNTDPLCASGVKDRSISAIVAERQQQLDAVFARDFRPGNSHG